MNRDRDFFPTLSNFLAFLSHLIRLFCGKLKGLQALSRRQRLKLQALREITRLGPSTKKEIISRLQAEISEHNNVPTFFQNYLLMLFAKGKDAWSPRSALMASRYLRRSAERFITWQRRQSLVAELNGEPIRGTELGLRQLIYSQGVGTVFRWRGIPCFKSIYDIAIYAMLIDELRPGTIIELGSGVGGSALFFADLCTAVGLTTQVVSIDTGDVEVTDSRIAFIQSDCRDWLEAMAKSKPNFQRPCLVVEDFHGDLTSCFADIDAILEVGDYLFIEDSHGKQNRIAELIADRPYLIDSKYTDFFGINCTSAVNGIFVKGTDASATTSS
jgi:cephalosporin hydroxylase